MTGRRERGRKPLACLQYWRVGGIKRACQRAKVLCPEDVQSHDCEKVGLPLSGIKKTSRTFLMHKARADLPTTAIMALQVAGIRGQGWCPQSIAVVTAAVGIPVTIIGPSPSPA